MKIVILDRDGVINEDSPHYVKSVAEWRPISGSLEAIARPCQSGYRVFVVSNHSGLGQGLFDYDAFFAMNDRRQVQVAERSDEHTSELQSLMRTSYAAFRLKKHK